MEAFRATVGVERIGPGLGVQFSLKTHLDAEGEFKEVLLIRR